MIAKEMVKFQKDQIRGIKKDLYGRNNTPDHVALAMYGSTEISSQNSEWIVGMGYTVELAMLIQSIADMHNSTTDPNPLQSHLKVMKEKVTRNQDGEESEALAEDDQTEDENAEGTKAGKGQHSGDTQDGLGEDSKRKNSLKKIS